MLAAERGAGQKHAGRVWTRSRRFCRLSRGHRPHHRQGGDRRRARAILATSDASAGSRRRPSPGVCRRSASFIDSFTPKACARTIRPPSSKDRSARARCRRRSRSPKSIGCCGSPAQSDPEAPLATRLRAARLSCLVELLYATGLRVSELVALPASAARREARVMVVRGKGNKERLVPLNNAAKTRMAHYLALLAEPGHSRRVEMAVPLVRRVAATSRASISPASSRRSPPRPGCARRKLVRTFCATPSPAISCTTAPTCVWCRRCSATPTFPPRRFTPTCWRSG